MYSGLLLQGHIFVKWLKTLSEDDINLQVIAFRSDHVSQQHSLIWFKLCL